MKRKLLLSLLCAGTVLLVAPSARAYDGSNSIWSTIARTLFPPKPHYDCSVCLVHAAAIAESRAHPRMTWHCWRYVKDALVEAGAISERPKSPWAREAGDELCGKFGFTKIPVRDPYDAPVGAVIVYGGPDAGHVELRSNSGFVSDFISKTPYPRPVIGVFVKT